LKTRPACSILEKNKKAKQKKQNPKRNQMEIFASIILNNIIPIFILISLGYLMDKKFNIDINSLSKLSLYLYVPAFTFVNLMLTDVSADLLLVVILAIALNVISFFVGTITSRILRLQYKTRKAFENAVVFNNSGNIGVSLTTLVFSNAPFVVDGLTPYLEMALSVQVMMLLVQNLSLNTFGFINSGGDGMTIKSGFIRVIKMPAIYMVACAVILKLLPHDIITGTPIWPALSYLRRTREHRLTDTWSTVSKDKNKLQA